jgi:plasmid stabilization system protein ParE
MGDLTEANSEFGESALWYLTEEPAAAGRRAAERFAEEVEQAYQSIQQSPYRYPIQKDGFRAWPLKRFPFSILYYIDSDEMVVASIYHHKRNRSSLKRRR